MSRTR
ncbi:hypothetical protein MG9_04143, partial [Candida albicans P37037]